MANYSDLQALFNNGMGSYAAVQAGAQTAFDRQVNDLKAQQMQQEINQANAMNPLNLQFKQQEIERQKAELPGVQGVSQSLSAKGQLDSANVPMQIAANLSKLKSQIGDEGMKQMGQDAQKAITAGSMLANIPTMGRPQALKNILEKYGVEADNPMIKPIMDGDPEQMPTALLNMGKGMALASEKYIQEQALARQQQEASAAQARETAAAHAASAREVAGINAGASKYAVDENNKARVNMAEMAAKAREFAAQNKPKSTDQAIAALSAIPESERTPAEQAQLVQLSQQKIAERSAGVNPLPAQVLGQPTAVQTAPQASPFVQGQQPSVQPAQSTAPAGMRQVGTYQGKPVYEDAQGKRFLGK